MTIGIEAGPNADPRILDRLWVFGPTEHAGVVPNPYANPPVSSYFRKLENVHAVDGQLPPGHYLVYRQGLSPSVFSLPAITVYSGDPGRGGEWLQRNVRAGMNLDVQLEAGFDLRIVGK